MRGVSIITPYNGSPYIVEFLRSLEQQSTPGLEIELIIVNGTGKPMVNTGFPVDYITKIISFQLESGQNRHTAGMLRNAGVKASRYDVLYFIDSDCLAQPGCLTEHLKIVGESPNNISCGLMRELPATHRSLVHSLNFDPTIILKDYREKQNQPEICLTGWEEMYSCNFAIHKKLFNMTGGFDESGFRCHDMDLGFRLSKEGARFFLNKRSVVIHVDHFRSLSYRINQIKGWQNLSAKFPNEIAERCSRRIAAIRNAYKEVFARCEAKFTYLHASLNSMPIVRVGRYLVADSYMEQIGSAIKKYAQEIKITETTTTIQLQLNRDCWDFGIIYPTTESVNFPFFSVIVTTWNSDESILKTLESIFLQTFQSFEILIVDDKSTDQTLQKLRPNLKSRRVRIVMNDENQGLSKCLNIGLQQSRGEFIVQLDSDDTFEPSALEEIYQCIQERQCDVLYGAPFIHRAGKKEKAKGWLVRSSIECLEYNTIQAPRVYRKTCLEQKGGWALNDGYEGRYFEDRLMLSRCYEDGKVYFLDKPIYNVFSKSKSLSRRAPLKSASAKYAIMINEANKSGKAIDFTFTNGFLHGKFRELSFSNQERSWSVVIPFSRNEDHLALTLFSWKQATERRTNTEIIVVNNSGKDILLSTNDFPNTYVINQSEIRNPAYSRNIGAQAAVNEFLFFCDEDHIVAPEILSLHEESHISNEKRIVIGGVFGRKSMASTKDLTATRIKKKILENILFDERFESISAAIACEEAYPILHANGKNIWNECFQFSYTDPWLSKWGEILVANNSNLEKFSLSWLRCGTGNLSILRDNFLHLQGFDESLYSMEDWEFGIRAIVNGMKIYPQPFLEPFHLIHERDLNRNNYNENSFKVIKEKHPLAFVVDESVKGLIPPGMELFHEEGPAKILTNEFMEQDRIKKSMISFDDGPHEFGTHVILNKLKELDLVANFFVHGEKVERNKGLFRKMHKDGHAIGLHGWNHIPFYSMSENEVIGSMLRTKNLLEDIIGQQVKYYRPPYGVISKNLEVFLSNMGFTIIGWHVSSKDWGIGLHYKNIISQIAAKGIGNKIILFHDGTGDPTQVARVLEWLKMIEQKYGYKYCSIPDFLSSRTRKKVEASIKMI